MVMISVAPIGWWLASAFVGILALVGITKRQARYEPEPDVDQRIADLTQKVRHPWRHRLPGWMR
jgi:hypothetical protein